MEKNHFMSLLLRNWLLATPIPLIKENIIFRYQCKQAQMAKIRELADNDGLTWT
jgi:hypothetical protein